MSFGTEPQDIPISAPPEERPIYQQHPELHHYTGWSGLCGIISSARIWATHFRSLNDHSEIEHLSDSLVSVLGPRFAQVLQIWRRETGSHNHKLLTRRGGADSMGEDQARRMVNAHYEVTFGPRENDAAFSSPYISSFCSHSDGKDYERHNGLLSQWRGYTGHGGYALVFDTKALNDLLEEEGHRYNYTTLRLDSVVYNQNDAITNDKFSTLLDRLVELFRREIYGEGGTDPNIYDPFVRAATRFKHRGFIEEREIRIVAAPMTEALRAKFLDHDPDDVKAKEPLKNFLVRKHNLDIPYIELFDFADKRPRLPIIRIIIGPSRDKKERMRQTRKFLQSFPDYRRIPIVQSATPFLGL